MIFPISSSWYIKLITISISVLWLLLVVNNVINGFEFIDVIGLGMYFIAMLFCILISPYQIEIIESEIIIKSTLKSINIPFNSIVSVKRIQHQPFILSFGTIGFGGIIGYTMGGETVLLKNQKKALRITTKSKNYIISCDEPNKLMETIAKKNEHL